jgi:hypothetical protein
MMDEAHIETLRKFLEEAKGKKIGILCHGDADGVSAGVLAYKAMKRMNQGVEYPLTPPKGKTAYSQETSLLLKKREIEALLVLDFGPRSRLILSGPTLFIDHHWTQVPPGKTAVISSYGEPVSSSLLAYQLFNSLVPLEDQGWLAVVGALDYLQESIPKDLAKAVFEHHSKKDLREITVLINSAHRCPGHHTKTAISVLLNAHDPKDVLDKKIEEVDKLYRCREQVNAEWKSHSHTAPMFMWRVALLPFSSSSSIEGMMAEAWRRNLSQYLVIAANSGWVRGMISFSARTDSGIRVMDFLNRIAPSSLKGLVADGDDEVAAGIVRIADWKRMLKRMKFKNVDELIH